MHMAMGRNIVVADRMDLHLLWDHNSIFLKPLPRFLLDPKFWQENLQCSGACACRLPRPSAEHNNSTDLLAEGENATRTCREKSLRLIARGFLHSYTCLISSETDFAIANEKRLLPRNAKDVPVDWRLWKSLARELIEKYNPQEVHSRFLRAELRVTRVNFVYRLASLPFFGPPLNSWNSYSNVFQYNLAWMAVATVFVGLVLTAMQVGLATERLQGNADFQRASYVFTIFAILAPIGAFGLVVLGVLLNLAMDLPWLVRDALGYSSTDSEL
ncbi:hypothetical protein PFICI_12519 [Pestalotiopsis fici W106-1]|uniref:Uncharacterized protein n=1 Tax=Pestalotiopsis fici (strain W106-1 / CGMCC3.15140) TaxID=1229662 RepID=W3WNS9_PESFW|nr:uncharacterized protein PFICI_12519 [Pestalotiopsis fici W106-1]ETS75575.1 hypothetical protein PFICI_12519 [Pestalotiopsis fici W106-1]